MYSIGLGQNITNRIILGVLFLFVAFVAAYSETPDGINILRERAEAGDSDAQYILGNLHYAGEFVEQNYLAAADYFLRAAKQQEGRAFYMLSKMVSRGEGPFDADETSALDALKRSAELGCQDAIDELEMRTEAHAPPVEPVITPTPEEPMAVVVQEQPEEPAEQPPVIVHEQPAPRRRVREGYWYGESIVGLQTSSKELQSGLYLEADFMRAVNRYYSIGVSIGYSDVDNKVNTLSKGTVQSIPFLIKSRFSTAGDFVSVYGEIGTGYVFYDHTLAPELTSVLSTLGLSYSEKINGSLGYSVGGGVRMALGKNIKVGIFMRRLFADPYVRYSLSGLGASFGMKDKVKLSTNMFGLTISDSF